MVDRAASASDLRTSWITYGELLAGAVGQGQNAVNSVNDLMSAVQVVYPDAATCEQYGRLHADLSARGKLIPVNDLWIAALALQHGMSVVTCDEHFLRIPDLVAENWLQ